MHTLVTADFDSAGQAGSARQVLLSLPSSLLPDVADAVIVTQDDNGTFQTDQIVNLWTTKTDGLSLQTLIRSALFTQPLIDIIGGPVAVRLRDALDDFGISPSFSKDLRDRLAAGHAALIALPRHHNAGVIVSTLTNLAGHVDQTPLEDRCDADVSDAFAAMMVAIESHHGNLKGLSQ